MTNVSERHIETMLKLTRRVVGRMEQLPLLSTKTRHQWERVYQDIAEQEAVARTGRFDDALKDIRACKEMMRDALRTCGVP